MRVVFEDEIIEQDWNSIMWIEIDGKRAQLDPEINGSRRNLQDDEENPSTYTIQSSEDNK